MEGYRRRYGWRGTFHQKCPIAGFEARARGTSFLRVGWMARTRRNGTMKPTSCSSVLCPMIYRHHVGGKLPGQDARRAAGRREDTPVPRASSSQLGRRSHLVFRWLCRSLPSVPRLSSRFPSHHSIYFTLRGVINVSPPFPSIPSSCSATAMLLSLKDLMNQVNKNTDSS